MLGHVYVVEDARDLAQTVRDVTRYGGAYRPEINYYLFFQPTFFSSEDLYPRLLITDIPHRDIYEFIQRRSDWKQVEKAVDKTMYNLSFKADCVV